MGVVIVVAGAAATARARHEFGSRIDIQVVPDGVVGEVIRIDVVIRALVGRRSFQCCDLLFVTRLGVHDVAILDPIYVRLSRRQRVQNDFQSINVVLEAMF